MTDVATHPSAPKPALVDKQEMDGYSAVRWSAFANIANQGVRFVISMVLARLLAPEYFGLLGMAMVVTGFASTFRDLGFHSVIIQRKELDDRLLSTIYWVNLVTCVVLGLIVAACSPLAAWCYSDARVTPIIAVLSLDFVLVGFTIVPVALLNRQLAFRKLAIRSLGGTIVMGLTGIALAASGLGVWALVGATLAGSATQLVLINLVCPFWPSLVFDWPRLKDSLNFGLNLTGFSIVNYFARNADNLIIGVFLGPAALGFYSVAYKLMLMPRNNVSLVVMKVLFPKLSRLQHDDAKLADTYLRAVGAIAFVTFPMMTGLAVVSPDFVQVVLGDKWQPAIPLIMLLAPLGAVQSIGVTLSQIFLARGRADLHFRWGVVSTIACVVAFLIGVRWGITGVTVSYLAASLITMPAGLAIAFRLVEGLSMRQLCVDLAPYAVCSAAMGAVTIASQAVLSSILQLSPIVVLTATVSIGVVSYASFILLWRPSHAMEVLTRFIPMPLLRRFLPSAGG